jgi:hypothetical protein
MGEIEGRGMRLGQSTQPNSGSDNDKQHSQGRYANNVICKGIEVFFGQVGDDEKPGMNRQRQRT